MIKELVLVSLSQVFAVPVRKRVSKEDAKRFAASYEANKTDYERAQGKPDRGGVAKRFSSQMIRAVAEDARKRQKR